MKKSLIYNFLFITALTTALHAFDRGSPLLNAVDNRNFEEVVRLVESGADVNIKNEIGFTPLLYAAGWGDIKMVKYLIDNGADLDARANLGFGVLHRAAMNKDPSVLKYLLKHYAFDVNDRGKSYCSPLDYALRDNALQSGGTLESAQILLTYGAKKSINYKCRGYTPLMVAAPDKKVIKFLLDNGADKTIKNPAGMTAYDLAKRFKASSDILAMLSVGPSNKRSVLKKGNLIWEIKTDRNRLKQYIEKEAVSYCRNLVIEGYDNWMIPTVADYETVLSDRPHRGFVIDGIDKFCLNPKEFPNMTPGDYWVRLKDGTFGYLSLSWRKVYKKRGNGEKHFVRCVREQ